MKMNLPNKLTMFRIALIPLFLIILYINSGNGATNWVAFAIFCVASATDAVDGYIEAVTLIPGKAVMIVNEEGVLLGMPSNLAASAVAGRKIVGPALVVGVDCETFADFVDVPRDIKKRIKVRWG